MPASVDAHLNQLAGGSDDRPSFDSEDQTQQSPPSFSTRLGSMKAQISFTSGADSSEAAMLSQDGILKDTDLVPLDEQDAAHNWEALNQRILDRMNDEHKWMVQNKIIHPMGTFRKKWDLIQVVLLAYVAIAVPYRICFDHDAQTHEFMFWFDVMVDMYFIIDIFVSFRTAFNQPNGDLEFHPKAIARNYLKSWFMIVSTQVVLTIP